MPVLLLVLLTLAFTTTAGESLLYSMVIQMVMQEWSLSGGTAALLGFGPVVAAALGGLLLGRFQDLHGRRPGLIAAMAILALFSLLTGLAQGPVWLALARTGTGFALGGVWTAAMTLLGETWPAVSRGRALALVQMGFPLGYMSAALVSYFAVPLLGWRGAFLANSAAALLELVAILVLVPESPLWRERGDSVRRDGSLTGLEGLFAERPLRRTVLLASAVSFLGMYGYWAAMTWVPTYLQEIGFAVRTVPLVMVAILTGALIGYPTFGVMGDRVGRRKTFQIFFAGMGLLLVGLGLAPVPAGTGGAVTVIAAGTALAFFSGYFSGYGPLLADLFPTRIRGVALGFSFNVGRLGSAIGPVVSGALIPWMGTGGAIAAAGAGFFLAILLVRRLPDRAGGEL